MSLMLLSEDMNASAESAQEMFLYRIWVQYEAKQGKERKQRFREEKREEVREDE